MPDDALAPAPTGDLADGVLAQRLNHLFEKVHPKGRKPYTLREAAAGINEKAGEDVVSRTYLSQLRNGKSANPGHKVLAAIAAFFEVPLSYFAPDEEASRIGQQLEALVAMRDAGVRRVAQRAAGLSSESLRAVLAVIENARRFEGLSDD
ncbi:helix-turn-helix domain-containing protein [Actinoplanes regularis]|uniref:Transcriptional regulator, contains XRE-family HTH domain n=1 Tax=Actinoplanes regularis TaxID=52697 RepID=A0A238XI29_9ACTN|nr:helix-turn-helix domain-containing protein [Actinoplanes regularis]GIE86826.1 nucleoid-associated protein EspR [Actinoplanes regularis]SNR58221.1 Transcriptional regulator, contains XRE-family HTH domain [Actinoplanes regularis]